MKAAVEETLRWAGPVGTSTRQTTRSTELAGVALEEGALIGAVLASANRDPRRWTEPDRFDLHRKEGAHLAFAAGTHFCLGAWFGRHLARVSLEILLDRLPVLRLDPAAALTLRGWEFRAPDALWVRWGPALVIRRPARAETVGSLLRPPALKAAMAEYYAEGHSAKLDEERAKDPTALRAVEDDAIRDVVRRQIDCGLDVVTDGEFRRWMFMNSFYDAVSGVRTGKTVRSATTGTTTWSSASTRSWPV